LKVETYCFRDFLLLLHDNFFVLGVDKEMLGNLCKEIGAPFVTVVGFDKVEILS
jgi:hypothetical protein